ncbi:MAG: family 20 glycosylhydrolase [Prolixibacteraceae bacterium]|jgi:hexosaminidase|nr:family 20 glycosylhydrolase [Prolixibacteraceae bacterium]
MSQFIKRFILFYIVCLFLIRSSAGEEVLSIIPEPVSKQLLRGEFILRDNTSINAEIGTLKNASTYLQGYISKKYGIRNKVVEKTPKKNFIRLSVTDTLKNREGYVLKVSNNSVEIAGASATGVFYGIQTFLQMLPPEAKCHKKIAVQAINITDFPRFSWRGQQLDVSRHFFPVDFIKKLMDVMAMHKLNVFHWHLTDDQGWRIEIKKYPLLTQIGAWRDSTLIGAYGQYPVMYDRERYGGYYTQEEIKDVVRYASERFITVVPEIEMPGHCISALAAYPELSCTGGPFGVGPRWGVYNDVFCAGKDKTYEFLENVLDEVIQLFPCEYIHIGGDEVPKDRWKNCNACKHRIHEEGLKDENELQGYFEKRIENYLHNKGKKVIGWDEIIDGGLPERAVVMSWRGVSGGIKSAKAHHYTIMTPFDPCYYYVYQGRYEEPLAGGDCNLASEVYNFDPVPDQLNEAEAEYILGGQGCAWSEYMPIGKIAEYMIVPRMSALSEALWSAKSKKNLSYFLERMNDQYLRMDYYDINYRVDYPANYGFVNRYLEEKVQITLDNIIPGSKIRYTTDGSKPVKSSKLYKGHLTLHLDSIKPVVLKSRTFMPNGRQSVVHEGIFVKLDWKASVFPEDAIQGLNFNYFEKELRSVEEIIGKPDRTGVNDSVISLNNITSNSFALVYDGYIKVPESTVYNFDLSNPKGKALLCIDDMKVVDNTAVLPHYFQGNGKIALKKGYHSLSLKYLTTDMGKRLRLGCHFNDKEIEEIPAAWFYH